MLQFNRFWTFIIAVAFSLTFLFLSKPYTSREPSPTAYGLPPPDPAKYDWSQRKQLHPVTSFHALPTPGPEPLPRIQHDFASVRESREDRATRRQRMGQVRAAMQRCWSSYRLKAWMADELAPVSGAARTSFGGWAATLVDSLDTLWIMGLKAEFAHAVDAAVRIDFSAVPEGEVNVFETNIRYLGGFLAAYDLSGDRRLLGKALEVANLLYAAFDTPNRMPVLRIILQFAMDPELVQTPPSDAVLAELGSFTLEMTRLSQITKDPKWYDAAHRIMLLFKEQQFSTALPGLWPVQVNAENADFSTGNLFSLAAMADSLYEYLPKTVALLGGSEFYAEMYNAAMQTALEYNLYRPMKQEDDDVIVTGVIQVDEGRSTLLTELQHLSCFAGGMLALGGQLLGNYTHVYVGERLTNGCTWAYSKMHTGVMPETSNLIPCIDMGCAWDEGYWHQAVLRDASEADRQNRTDVWDLIHRERIPTGFSSIVDRRYMLRPEAIESVFILYRITGNTTFQDTAWDMFRRIYTHTVTDLANTEILDVTNSSAPRGDKMESFWTAETLKYFYLIFADPNYISLDEYVFNTEAHPFKRPSTDLQSGNDARHWKWR